MSSSIAAIYMFVSGCAALVYEVLWSRDLAYLFGGSAAAIAPVVAAFLTGLALGAWLGGRRLVAKAELLGRYALLELAIALFAPLVPWLVAALDRALLDPLWPSIEAAHAEVWARFAVAFVVMVPATACMGATLPVLCAAFAGARDRTGALIGRLYGWNTLGGVAGCLLAGFVLVEHVGLWRGRLVAAALNLALAAAAWRRARRPASAAAPPPELAVTSREAPAGEATRPELGRPFALALLAASAAISIALELTWTRLVALGVGGTTYAFSIVLAIYLGGLGAGALGYASSVRRGVRATVLLALAQLLLAAFLLATHPLADDWIARAGQEIFEASGRGGSASLLARSGMGLLLCVVLVFLPALLLGVAFPALSDLNVRARERIGAGVGGAYVWSTAGGVAGSIATTWWLLPRIGLEGILIASAGCALLLGALLVAAAARRAVRGAALAAAVAVAGAAALALVAETGRWELRGVYGGIGLYGAPRALAPNRKLLAVTDGPTCSVAVFEAKGERSLSVNGKVDASTRRDMRGDMNTQLLLAWLPALFVDDAKEIFVLGYGAGVTAASGAKWGASVECAEIEPAVVAASHWFCEVNGDASHNPAIELVVDDGRSRLRRSRRRFDVVTTEPSNPWLAGMASLFTVEFYELCRARMNPDGVLCQWVQLYWSSPEDYQAIFATLGTVFPEVAIWRSTSGDTLMLGSQRPLRFDPGRITRQASTRPWLAAALAPAEAGGSADPGLVATLARMVLLEGADARAFADAGPRKVRDDVPFLEFTAARRMLDDSGQAVTQRIYAARRTPLYGEAELAKALPESTFLLLLRDVAADALYATQSDGGGDSRKIAATVAEPLLAEAARRAARLERLPFWRWLCARRRGDAAAESARLEELVRLAPTLLLQVAEEHARTREFDPANAMLARLEQAVGANAAIEYERGEICKIAGDRREAARRYERALKLDPDYAAARDALRELAESK